MPRLFLTVAALVFLALSPVLATETIKPLVDQQLQAEMKALAAQIKADKAKIDAAKAKLKPDIERLKTNREKMKSLREKAKAQREAWKAAKLKATAPTVPTSTATTTAQ